MQVGGNDSFRTIDHNPGGMGSHERQQKITYPNGDRYEGEYKNDLRHGKGTFTAATGETYEGDWHEDLMHGYGEYRFADGRIYVGEFRNGKIHGQGKITPSTSISYEGEFKDNKIDGKGEFNFQSLIIKGENFQANIQYIAQFRGFGILTHLKDSRRYEGDFVNGMMDGKGIMRYPDGSVYEGGWKESKYHGSGKFTKVDGVYEGQWHFCRREDDTSKFYQYGQGTISYRNGNSYEGKWQENLQHGQGTFTYAEGGSYVGEWQKGLQHGQGKLIYPNKTIEEGIFINNVLVIRQKNIEGLEYNAGTFGHFISKCEQAVEDFNHQPLVMFEDGKLYEVSKKNFVKLLQSLKNPDLSSDSVDNKYKPLKLFDPTEQLLKILSEHQKSLQTKLSQCSTKKGKTSKISILSKNKLLTELDKTTHLIESLNAVAHAIKTLSFLTPATATAPDEDLTKPESFTGTSADFLFQSLLKMANLSIIAPANATASNGDLTQPDSFTATTMTEERTLLASLQPEETNDLIQLIIQEANKIKSSRAIATVSNLEKSPGLTQPESVTATTTTEERDLPASAENPIDDAATQKSCASTPQPSSSASSKNKKKRLKKRKLKADSSVSKAGGREASLRAAPVPIQTPSLIYCGEDQSIEERTPIESTAVRVQEASAAVVPVPIPKPSLIYCAEARSSEEEISTERTSSSQKTEKTPKKSRWYDPRNLTASRNKEVKKKESENQSREQDDSAGALLLAATASPQPLFVDFESRRIHRHIRNVTAKEIFKQLYHLGFRRTTQGGSHCNLIHPFLRTKVTVPVHGPKPLSIGVAKVANAAMEEVKKKKDAKPEEMTSIESEDKKAKRKKKIVRFKR